MQQHQHQHAALRDALRGDKILRGHKIPEPKSPKIRGHKKQGSMLAAPSTTVMREHDTGGAVCHNPICHVQGRIQALNTCDEKLWSYF